MTEDAPRPEVVDAIFKAIWNQDPKALDGIDSITPAERRAADELFMAAMLATSDHRERETEVWSILVKRQWASPPSWDQLWSELTEADLEQLRERYDALPDEIRRRLDAHDERL